MNLEETEARSDCAGKDQQHLTDRPNELVVRQSPADKNVSVEAEDIVGIHHQATTGEDIAICKDFMSAVVTEICEVSRTVTA
jgi:hypothetical protein